MKTHFIAAAIIVSVCLIASSVLGQGALTPPGSPAPTMKSLDQVEPRTPITNLPVNLSQTGSYYLTKSFIANFTSDALTISASNVTVDLCGFTIQDTTNTTGVVGVRLENNGVVPIANAVVKNGSIVNFASSGIFGFAPQSCVFEDIGIFGCGGGMTFQSFGSFGAAGVIVRRCRTSGNFGSGIVFSSGSTDIQNVIMDCDALNNSSAGFSLASSNNLIIRCRASGNANNYVIAANNRIGTIVQPSVVTVSFSGSTGGPGSGTTDPFANLSY